ncbi:hypothetical protein PtA15_8A73 [Puccinia triticina]|uniref:Uncharacterized protein n=1 Tax=Puccinia triticina TaxID=208348 RepID=A0ABY7CRS1_9BASI|nr:uncharacterized protein PtA15_8A73 [Puccinia triticina]WAQ87172.1 hypothetical protein PtA15_8A73 [Puccinia triticina]
MADEARRSHAPRAAASRAREAARSPGCCARRSSCAAVAAPRGAKTGAPVPIPASVQTRPRAHPAPRPRVPGPRPTTAASRARTQARASAEGLLRPRKPTSTGHASQAHTWTTRWAADGDDFGSM